MQYYTNRQWMDGHYLSTLQILKCWRGVKVKKSFSIWLIITFWGLIYFFSIIKTGQCFNMRGFKLFLVGTFLFLWLMMIPSYIDRYNIEQKCVTKLRTCKQYSNLIVRIICFNLVKTNSCILFSWQYIYSNVITMF